VTADSAIGAHDLDVVRGGKQVLNRLDFEVTAGSVTGLLGPSGSGKSTLIRAVVGVQRHVTGALTVLDRPAGDPSLRAEVAYVTQAPSVYGDLTVTENLDYFGRCIQAEAGAVDQVIDQVGLGDEAGRVVGTLSGGQHSRVSLATALLGDPRLLVLDEPTVGLDPVLRDDLWNRFHDLADSGVTLLVSSHVMEEADRCDRILILRDGSLMADETPDGLRAETGCQSLDEAFLALIRRRET
jgi:ABC-2 type transport system ATP-binding protein